MREIFTKKCKNCKKEIDQVATTCHHCDTEQKNNTILKLILILLIIVLLIPTDKTYLKSIENFKFNDFLSEIDLNDLKNKANSMGKEFEDFINDFFKDENEADLQFNDRIIYNDEIYEFILEDGYYDVGIDIDPGTYMLVSPDGDEEGWYEIYDGNMDDGDLLQSNSFQGNRYINLRENECILLGSCILVKPEINPLDMKNYTNQENSMYKVGVDIKPGTYKLQGLYSNPSYEIYDDVTSTGSPIKKENFLNEVEVELKKGQFLNIVDSKILLD